MKAHSNKRLLKNYVLIIDLHQNLPHHTESGIPVELYLFDQKERIT